MANVRYARQLILREIGSLGQEKLKSSKVLVIGAGGLGSAALGYLAAAGVGTLGVADGDRVEEHNLNRQLLHPSCRVGWEKTASAELTLREQNPELEIKTYPYFVTSENICPLIREYDFVLDCVDRFETKFLINDACVLEKKPYCHAGAVRFGGQVTTVVPGKGPCLRCLLGSPPQGATCEQIGVLGAAVGVIGSIQALEAIKFLVGAKSLLTGRVLRFDGWKMEVKITDFPHADPNCPVCGGGEFSIAQHREEYGEI